MRRVLARRSGPRPVTLLCPPFAGGGAERVMATLAAALAKRGHTVHLLLARGAGPRADSGLAAIPMGVRVLRWGPAHAARGHVQPTVLQQPVRAAAVVPALAHYFASARPRAVLSTLVGLNAASVAAAALLPARLRPRVVVREANTLPIELRFRPFAARAITSLAARSTYPRADAIVAVSQQAAASLADFLGVSASRVCAIPNPSVSDEMLARAEEHVDDAWFRAERDAPVVVAAGRLVVKKGFATLLDAFALVRRMRRARLLVMGEGPERARLEALVASAGLGADVRLAGFVDNPFSRFARADLFVLASEAEGMPNALVEALACGCPVVATDCPSGPSEVLDGGTYGALVPVGDARSLAGAILAALEAPPPRDRLRARGAEFHADRIALRYARVLEVEDTQSCPRA